MSQKKRGLGRGLGDLGLQELLNDMTTTSQVVETSKRASPSLIDPILSDQQNQNHLKALPVDRLMSGRYQPRRHMDQEALQELANSIRTQGIIQPIVVRRMGDKYEIIAGERRWRAAQLAELEHIPAIIRDISDEAAVAIALIENIQRRDLNPMEESIALQRLLDEFQMTHQEVADAIGKSRAAVTNLLRLQKLNSDVRALVEQGQLDMGQARALLALEGMQQSEVAKQVMQRGMSVRETEQLIRKLQSVNGSSKQEVKRLDPDIARLQTDLSEKLGAKIAIQHSAKGKGKLVIHYTNLEELDGILDHIQ